MREIDVVDVHSTIQNVAELATAGGVFVAARQLVIARRQQTAVFEQEFTTRYRDINGLLPLWAVIGTPGEQDYCAGNEKTRRAFYDYFELCEEQMFYVQRGRVSKKTWQDWREGIEANMNKRAFRAAWTDISTAAPEQFELFRSHALASDDDGSRRPLLARVS